MWYRTVPADKMIPMKWTPLAALTIVAVALLASACASTGAVPQPFPGAGRVRTAPRAATPEPERSDRADASATSPEAAPLPMDSYALVGTALALRGTPYRNGGSDPSGFDCSGFTQYVFARYGIALGRGVRDQFHQGQQIEASEIAPGDLVFFTTTEPGASHVAIAIGGNQFVHAPSSTGVVRVERLGASYWSQRYIGARRIAPTVATQQ
jgi:cell wall-associated NlpC family hydrolase